MICVRSLSRTVPTNYILLLIFTICESWLVSMVAGNYSPDIVLAAFGMTAGMTLGLTVYALTTKADFTVMWAGIWMFGFSILMFGLFAIIFQSEVLYMFYCVLVVVLFGFYLIIDTQLILGGKRYELSEDEYILGALILYIDIIIIFLYLLRIFGGSR